MRFKLFIFMAFVKLMKCESGSQPNIVFIVADDLGWDDVSFHGSDQIMTPNIDVLACQGVIIPEYYTDTYGTPSRSALFTGKYPIRTGTQGISIAAAEDRGLPPTERLLPEHLQQLGYTTHLIGKWDLGKSREHYLPTNRGFHSFYGFLGSSVDYFTYNRVETWNETVFYGLDLFHNLTAIEDQRGHLTDILTDRAVKIIKNHNTSVPLYLHISHAAPHIGGGYVNLQTPEDTIAANDHIAHSARRYFAGLTTGFDRSIGHIVAALAERKLLNDTIIVLISDNGAASTGYFRNFGCNLPLRGSKGTPWEGAVRTTAIIWHSSLPNKIYPGLFHVTDWLPTIMTAVGSNYNSTTDGIDQWNAITKDEPPPRNELLITIDDLKDWAAFRLGNYKIIIGDVDPDKSHYIGMEFKKYRLPKFSYENVLQGSQTARVFKDALSIKLDLENVFMKRNHSNLYKYLNKSSTEALCMPTKIKGCLFNITADPTEAKDLWSSSPEIVKHMVLRLRMFWAEINPREKPKLDLRANPALHNFIWYPWLDNEQNMSKALQEIPAFPLRVSVGELQYFVNVNLNSFRDSFSNYIKSAADAIAKTIAELFSF